VECRFTRAFHLFKSHFLNFQKLAFYEQPTDAQLLKSKGLNKQVVSNSDGFAFFIWQKIEFTYSQINIEKKKRLSPMV
jgi:hypothetical protein